jgi:hypothetical protein
MSGSGSGQHRTALKQGWLTKDPSSGQSLLGNKKRRRRFIVLYDTSIEWFEDDKLEMRKGVLPLSHQGSATQDGECLTVVSGSTTLRLYGDHDVNLESWAEAIRTQIVDAAALHAAQPRSPPPLQRVHTMPAMARGLGGAPPADPTLARPHDVPSTGSAKVGKGGGFFGSSKKIFGGGGGGSAKAATAQRRSVTFEESDRAERSLRSDPGSDSREVSDLREKLLLEQMAHEQAKEALREVETRLKEAQSECELAKKARDAVVAAPSKDWPPAINEAMHAAEAKQADPEEHDPGWAWDTTKWLDSIKTSKWVAEALLRPLRAKPSGTAGGSAANAANLTELQFLRALGDPDKVSDENRVGAILWLLKQEDLWMKTAATNIAAKLRDLHSAAAVSSEMQFGRFVRDTPLLKYDSVSSFFGGLEERVGRPTPNKDLVDEIRREHEEGKDAEREFTTRNYNVKTTSKMEWKFVKSPEETRRAGWPEEDPNRLEEVYHRKPKEKDDDLKTTMDSKNKELQGLAKLQLAEAYGAMLYTGPMYMKCTSTPSPVPANMPAPAPTRCPLSLHAYTPCRIETRIRRQCSAAWAG